MKLIRNTFTRSTILLLCLAPIITSGEDSPLTSIRKSMDQLPDPVTNEDYYEGGRPSSEKVDLGRLLFFDKILSGNQNISCATCHHPEHGTSDGVSLSFGEGALGLGPKRHPGTNKSRAVHGRIPRNSPALFNLGSKEFTKLFHDGRVESDPNGYYEGGFITPAKWKLPKGLESVLAAQAMFPVASADEMAGQKGENPIADSASLNNAAGKGGVWELLAERLRRVPEYSLRFRNAFPEEIQKTEDITYVHAANAIAAFEGVAFRADNSPFDQFLRGDEQALSAKALSGMKLFYGKARCFDCHSGKFQTDHDFHAIAMAQVGPGKSDGQDSAYWRASGHRGFLEDFGRGRVTVREEDKFKFRTPSLRNTETTGPWGHAGAYASLEEVIRHHLDPEKCLENYVPSNELFLPLKEVLEVTAKGSSLDHVSLNQNRLTGFLMRDTWVVSQPELRQRIASANELKPITLTDLQVKDLIAFMHSLSDASNKSRLQSVPQQVPSGLPVKD
jgi:cytochrome c peroxidase